MNKLNVVKDLSMMDWLADEEFNSMTGSGSGSGCGCGSGSMNGDIWELAPCYVQAGTLSSSRGTAEVGHTVYVSWEAGVVPTRITVSVDAVWYVGNRSYPCTVKNVTARWVGVYGITVSGQIVCSGGHTQTILEGFTVPEHLRGRKE